MPKTVFAGTATAVIRIVSLKACSAAGDVTAAHA